MNRSPHDPSQDELELLRRLRRLPAAREPQRDLWPAIESRLGTTSAVRASPRGRRAANWRAFALAASVAAVAVLVTRLPAPQPERAAAARPDATPAAAPASPLRHEADALTLEYRLALEPFAQAPLPPALHAATRELDASADELRSALRARPEATFLLDRLRRTYARRLELTQRGALG